MIRFMILLFVCVISSSAVLPAIRTLLSFGFVCSFISGIPPASTHPFQVASPESQYHPIGCNVQLNKTRIFLLTAGMSCNVYVNLPKNMAVQIRMTYSHNELHDCNKNPDALMIVNEKTGYRRNQCTDYKAPLFLEGPITIQMQDLPNDVFVDVIYTNNTYRCGYTVMPTMVGVDLEMAIDEDECNLEIVPEVSLYVYKNDDFDPDFPMNADGNCNSTYAIELKARNTTERWSQRCLGATLPSSYICAPGSSIYIQNGKGKILHFRIEETICGAMLQV